MPSDLLAYPCYRADQLGLPMPDDPHAVSACLPLWDHNVGYEEGHAAVHEKLRAAYPRFCFHPKIKELSARFLDDDDRAGLPFASPRIADRAVAYLRHASVEGAEIVSLPRQTAAGVVVPRKHFPILKQYWQHAGENLSSRGAEQVLAGDEVTFSETTERSQVRRRVAELHGLGADSVRLFASGMAAIASAWRVVNRFHSNKSDADKCPLTCQFGFPYVDTLKIQQRFPGARHVFYPIGNNEDVDRLAAQCASEAPVAIFCEVPTNPLLLTPHLQQLRELADAHDILLVVDDTLGACGNLNVLPYADLIVTSLTKYFSGYGNVLAGSLIVNPQRTRASLLAQLVSDDFEETLCDADADVLCRNSVDVQDRVSTINSNAKALAEFLAGHTAVETVFYPKSTDDAYELIRTPNGGYGGLLSIVLCEAAQSTPAVFDALRICKGPNLGTNFTLCCPYTILAHYDELDVVERCGVSRWLLRVSVGTESIDDLIERFSSALNTGEKSP